MTVHAEHLPEHSLTIDRPCKVRAPCSYCSFNPDGDCPHGGLRADGRDYRGHTLAPGRHIETGNYGPHYHPPAVATLPQPSPGTPTRRVSLNQAIAYCLTGRWQ